MKCTDGIGKQSHKTITGDVLITTKLFFVLVEGPDMSRIEATATGGRKIDQAIRSLQNEIWLYGCLEAESRIGEITLAEELWNSRGWKGGIIFAERLHKRGYAGHAPSEL
jgi:hypothetical protein